MNEFIKDILEHGDCNGDCPKCPFRDFCTDCNDAFAMAEAYKTGVANAKL